MQDHAEAIRKQFIDDYAARVKLGPIEQRDLWFAHLRATKHPRMEPNPRLDPRLQRSPFKVLAEIEAVAWANKRQMERDLTIREALENERKDRAARETWKSI